MKSIELSAILKGTVIALAVTLLFICAAALMAYFALIDDSTATVILFAGVMAGVFFGAVPAVRRSGSKRLLNSLCVGAVYIAVLIAAALALNRGIEFNIHFITLAVGCVGAAFLSAMVFSPRE